MRIRDAAPADAAACDLLRRSIAALCGADHGGDPAAWLVSGTPADLAAWIGAPGNVVLPAEAAGRLLGVGATTAAGKVRLT